MKSRSGSIGGVFNLDKHKIYAAQAEVVSTSIELT